MKTVRRGAFFLILLLTSVSAFGQSHELAITGGANFPRNNAYDSDASFAVGGYYAGRIFYVPLAGLYFEVPVVVAPESVTDLPSRDNYSALFVTPGLKLKFAPEFPISPWIAVGGGFARYKVTSGIEDGRTSNVGVWDFGGGIDMKIAPFFSVRGEVRDFYTGDPDLRVSSGSGRQHNIVPQAGLVFRF
ncbi:MAG TPA: hypothetical protein VEG32_01665 [Clostridia bacterium]|nr:hypothetical protein [Clostridia bacterium]